MLEKIGLPPKPSLRGNNWVVDASNCQGCSAQFTFLNRKHHCRRCGGIFCNSCTQQRMVLRGQGDSPVRICEPCKKLEEAARFEMRYGHKNKVAKGNSKLTSKKEADILSDILGTGSSASSSNIQEIMPRDEEVDNLSSTEVTSTTPEELRQQALAEKNKYRTLKAEGKSEEALRAFKRGKELERQAGSLEISLRKTRKRALSSSTMDDNQQIKDEKNKLSTHKSKEKDDLSDQLKELGWSDLDLRDTEKKPANLTLEGELSSLLREVSQKKPIKENQKVLNDKSQVLSHKRRALELKRAGNLIEAKEELKKAKVLEKKIEEEELLGGDDDESDDELSSLIRSMDDEGGDDLSKRYKSDINFDFDHFVGIGDDLTVDVTNEDLDDPEMASALKSLGWEHEETDDSENITGRVDSSNKESLLNEIRSLKKEALARKREGDNAEAMALLKKAKILESELEKSSIESIDPIKNTGPKKSKLTIQKELIAMKKTALSLRREGRLDESEEELKRAKVLQEELLNMDNYKAPIVSQQSLVNVDEEEEVTDRDLRDPSYLSLLKNLGWEEEEEENVKILKENDRGSMKQSISENWVPKKSKTEIQRELLALKRKALTLRRQGESEEADEVLKMAKSLEAQLQEYEEPMKQDISSENNVKNSSIDATMHDTKYSHQIEYSSNQEIVRPEKLEEIVPKSQIGSLQRSAKSSHQIESSSNQEKVRPEKPEEIVPEPQINSLQQEILAHKRKAVALKREGKLVEAKEELRQAKILEKRMEEDTKSNEVSPEPKREAKPEPKPEPNPEHVSVSKPLSSRERFKLQQKSLNHKRQSLKLRREGRIAEADAEYEFAKAIESQLEESDANDPSKSSKPVDDVSVEDFLDPQLLSALRSIGLEDPGSVSEGSSGSVSRVVEGKESTKSNLGSNNNNTSSDSHKNNGDADLERVQLAELLKAEKVKAVTLKRAGKQAEALDALRRAKLYEKKLLALSST